MRLKKTLRHLVAPKYEPLNRIEIVAKNILANLAYLQTLQPQAEIFPVLKSNAYGHGLENISTILDKTSVPMLLVDSFPEARVVYQASKKRVLLLGEASLSSYKYCDPKRTDFVVYNPRTLRLLTKLFKQPRVHLFVNTGMNREGILDLESFLEAEKTMLSKAEVVGYCSHLASADVLSDLNQLQTKRFFQNLEILQRNGFQPKYIHLGNSAGTFVLQDKRLNAFRTGLALYGYNPLDPTHPRYELGQKLVPALRVVSRVVSVQRIRKGETVSYLGRFKAERDTIIAIIPFGYFEGLDRHLSNTGMVKVRNQLCKIAGAVCMNLTCIDVADLPVQVGDDVEIIGLDSKDPNSVVHFADIQKTIPYEVLVRLQSGIRRMTV